MLVSLSETSPEAYFRYSLSTVDSCCEGVVSSSTDRPTLNQVGCDLPLVARVGWTTWGISDAVGAVPADFEQRYWCICTRCHWDTGKVTNHTYNIQNGLLCALDIMAFPFSFDPCETYGRIEDWNMKLVVRVVISQLKDLHMAMTYALVLSIRT